MSDGVDTLARKMLDAARTPPGRRQFRGDAKAALLAEIEELAAKMAAADAEAGIPPAPPPPPMTPEESAAHQAAVREWLDEWDRIGHIPQHPIDWRTADDDADEAGPGHVTD